MRAAIFVACTVVVAFWCWIGFLGTSAEQSVLLPITLDEKSETSPSKTQSVVLFTYVFGQKAAEKRYLRLFLETAKSSGVDVVVIGDAVPDATNEALFHYITWKGFCDRVQEYALDGHDPQRLRAAPDAYKIIDFKPLTGALFPELVSSYQWWGHVDNDMLLGSVLSAVEPLLSAFDVISGIPDHPTWGPFTLFRNNDVINQLFRRTTADLKELFDTEKLACFDEWGQCTRQRGDALRSMSAILEKEQQNPEDGSNPIRVYRGGFPLTWDGVCKFRSLGGTQDHQCATCRYYNGTLETLSKERKWEETLLCHYEYAKARLESSLESDATFNEFLTAGDFEVSFREGFKRVTKSMGLVPSNNPSQSPARATTLSDSPMPKPFLRNATKSIPKTVLATYVFSEEAASRKYLRLFVQTASTSGAEAVWIIGDTVPPFDLPPNVHHLMISWNDLCNLVHEKLDIPVDRLLDARPYKVNDFKPLLAFLFPTLVVGYEYWGTCDNDLLVGDMGRLWPHDLDFDVLSGSADHATWGPITLYKNTPSVTTMFQQATISLERIFNNEKPVCFDEWGSCGFKRWPGASMAGIVERSGIQVAHVPTAWDGWCHFPRYGKSKHHCAECLYRDGALWLRSDSGWEEVFVCHYQYTKSRLDTSLQDESIVNELLSKRTFQVSYLKGAKPVA